MKKLILNFILCFCSLLVNANSPGDWHRIDSLKILLNTEKDNSKLALLYYDIADIYYYSLPDSSLFYMSEYLKAAEKADNKKLIADAYYWISDLFYYTDLDSSLLYSIKFMEASKVYGDSSWVAEGYYWLGDIYYQIGNIELAIENYKVALDYFMELKDSSFIGACYNNIGYTISYGSDQPTGLNYFLKAYEIAVAANDSALISNTSANIAYYYERIKDFNTAHSYYKKALDLDIGKKDSTAIASSYAGLAQINILMKEFKEADILLKASKSYISGKHTPYYLAELYSSYIDCYLEWNNVDSASYYIVKVEEKMIKYRNPMLVAKLQQQKGYLSFLKGDYLACIAFLDNSIRLYKEFNSSESFALTYTKKAEAYSALHRYKEAYEAQSYANVIADSLKYNVIAGMLSKLEQERLYQNQLELNRLENELETKTLENTNIKAKANLKLAAAIIILLIMIAAIAIYFFISLRKKNKALEINNSFIDSQKLELEKKNFSLEESRKELKELNATKDKFFSLIAHDLRNPLSAIIGLSELYLENPEKLSGVDLLPMLESMNSTANYGFSLLENLLEWARTQTGVIQPKPKKLILENTIKGLKNDLKAIAGSKNIEINFISKKMPCVYADENMVKTVLRNLLHNSIKFSYENSVVNVSASSKSGFLITSIEDQGIGISQEELSMLFALDKQVQKYGTKNEPGTGLGLVLCKEFIEKNGGRIWASGEENKGCKFSFSLPLCVDNLNN